MTRRPCRWRQRDVTRAMKAAKAAGINARVDIAPDGKLSVVPIEVSDARIKINIGERENNITGEPTEQSSEDLRKLL